jgi:hypothetical protein
LRFEGSPDSIVSPQALTQQQRADAGVGVKILGRWHDVAARSGVLIMESDDIGAVHRYIGLWNPHLEIALVPVVDDEESVPICRDILSANNTSA